MVVVHQVLAIFEFTAVRIVLDGVIIEAFLFNFVLKTTIDYFEGKYFFNNSFDLTVNSDMLRRRVYLL